MAALEAQSCGLPMITTNSSSMSEIVIQGKTGFLCEQDNIDEFVNRVKQLKESPELSIKLANAARKRSEVCFSEPLMIDKYIKLYHQAYIDKPPSAEFSN